MKLRKALLDHGSREPVTTPYQPSNPPSRIYTVLKKVNNGDNFRQRQKFRSCVFETVLKRVQLSQSNGGQWSYQELDGISSPRFNNAVSNIISRCALEHQTGSVKDV
jgi:hypothetical protein